MKSRRLAAILLAILMVASTSIFAQSSSMTDKQVLEYVVSGLETGKDQKTIAMELARRGVTQEQAMRVKKMYEQQAAGEASSTNSKTTSASRMRTQNSGKRENAYVGNDFSVGVASASTSASGNGRTRSNSSNNPQDPNSNGSINIQNRTFPGNRITDETTLQDPQFIMEEALFGNEQIEKTEEKKIFGRNIFNSDLLTFEPSMNLATPKNYRLGAGDEIIIDIWGSNEATIQQQISPDGCINIESLGLVYLNGKTIEEANSYLRKELDKIYNGIEGSDPTSFMQVSLGQSRTIQVNVMGEVSAPGTYTLSSFATVFHAIYSAGGMSEIGSLRNIKVVRNGAPVITLDIYKMILDGVMPADCRLEEGDVVVVNAYNQLIDFTGNVKRPMYYEMKDGETLADAFKYCGGFSAQAYSKNIRIFRHNGNEKEIYTIAGKDFSSFKTQDGDSIFVDAVLERYKNRLEIKGAVYRPGYYQLGKIQTVRQLVEAADGLMGDAFVNRAVLQREQEDFSKEIISVDVKGIMSGSADDIFLQKNDILYIPSVHDLNDLGKLTIHGEVARPGEYVYASNMTVEDLIIQAGGLLETASTVQLEVARRIKAPDAIDVSDKIGETFQLSIKDGFIVDGDRNFTLQPYDEIYVRRSPAYKEQQNVNISGEVLFSGYYALTHKTERLSDLITKAGGTTQFAYIKGARLTRKYTPEELARRKELANIVKTSADSLTNDMLDLSKTTYPIGINLEEALNNPGSNADIILCDGDKIFIPEFTNVVKISGAVLYPNTVSFAGGKRINYYIEQAGGYNSNAKKSGTYIVYMNGQVLKGKRRNKKAVEPGCEIIVPMKNQSSWSVQQTLSVATASASLATMVATIANLMK